jgi:hypothetical protein
MTERKILILARRDHTEAMRVAAGLTVAGHQIRIVFMTAPVEETPQNAEQAEILELSEIEPETTVREMSGHVAFLDVSALGLAISEADFVINV